MRDLYLDIITPDRKVYSDEIKLIQVPGSKAPFAVLRNHAPILSTLDEGRIRIVDKNNKEIFYQIEGGIIEVMNNKVIILAETI